jgi:5'(3')-deoxyribonucleotidase
MIILIDVDGVIADFYGSLLEHVNLIVENEYPDKKARPKIPKFDVLTDYWCEKQFPPELQEISTDIVSQSSFWAGLQEIPGSINAINRIYEAGHTIKFVTSPTLACDTWLNIRLDWLQDRFGWATKEDLIVCSCKEYIDGDIFIDDYKKNIDAWENLGWRRNRGLAQEAVLFTAPYNKCHLTADWGDILKALGIKNGINH